MTAPVAVVLMTRKRDIPATGYPTPVPGLVVVRDPTKQDELYAVVHAGSGVCVVGRFPNPECALAAAGEFGALLDFTASIGTVHALVNAPETRRRIVAVANRFGGAKSGGVVGAAELASRRQEATP